MAKRKTVKTKLTDADVKKIAEQLVGKTTNLYSFCRSTYSIEADDALFDRLRSVGNVYRCVECNVWQQIEKSSPTENRTEICDECRSIIDGDDID